MEKPYEMPQDWQHTPQPIRFLNETGKYAPNETAKKYEQELEDVDTQKLCDWYTLMARTRAFDTECTNLQRQGQLALWVPSLGQEGCQAGVAAALAPQDHVFPAYREHVVALTRGVEFHELAKLFRGLSHGGWNPADPAKGNFHLYTLVLGAQAHHATGYALGQVLHTKNADAKETRPTLDPAEPGTATGEATMVFYGDGTTSQGEVNEALVFAASYQTPEVFVLQNNRWAISVPVSRQSRTPLYKRALGFGVPAVQVDGNDPLAAYAVAKRFMRDAREGRGPALIEALTYRMGAHTTSDDPSRYRDKEELTQWQKRDPLARLRKHLESLGVDDDFFAATATEAAGEAEKLRDTILNLPAPTGESMFENVYGAPHPRMREQSAWFTRYENSFANPETEPATGIDAGNAKPSATSTANTATSTPVPTGTAATNTASAEAAPADTARACTPTRPAFTSNVQKLTQPGKMPLVRAINEGLRTAMLHDESILLLGEDIGKLGGVFRATDGLLQDFGSARILDTPLAEAGIVGGAIGLAMNGFKPVVEIQFDGFVFPAINQIVTQLARLRNRHAGLLELPVTIRLPYGGHIGAIEHHQESPEAYFAHTPGLRIMAPATAADAYWMIQEAIACPDPVIFMEPKAKYWTAGPVDPQQKVGVASAARVAREGNDCTLAGYGAMVSTLMQAAEIAAAEGTSIEVVDMRSISPLDYEPLLASVRKTGRLVVAQEAPGNASVASEIAAYVAEHAFYSLQAPVLRVTGYDVPFPPAHLEGLFLPDADRVLEAVDRTMHY